MKTSRKLDNFIYEGDLVLDVIPFSFEDGKEEEQIHNILELITPENEVQENGIDAAAIVPLIPNGDNYEITDDDYSMAAEPFECYKWNRFDQAIIDFFGGDKTILVGCYKDKKQREWILGNNLYNVRLGKTKGSVEEHRDMFDRTTLLVLYELDKPERLTAFKVEGHQQMGRDELKAMGYPSRYIRKSYMTFNITPLEMNLDFLIDQHLIEKLIEIEIDPEKERGTPVFIEP